MNKVRVAQVKDGKACAFCKRPRAAGDGLVSPHTRAVGQSTGCLTCRLGCTAAELGVLVTELNAQNDREASAQPLAKRAKTADAAEGYDTAAFVEGVFTPPPPSPSSPPSAGLNAGVADDEVDCYDDESYYAGLGFFD